MFIKYELNILKFQTNWSKHCGDIGMLKSLFFNLHYRRAVGIVGNKTCDVTVGKPKECGKFETFVFKFTVKFRRKPWCFLVSIN